MSKENKTESTKGNGDLAVVMPHTYSWSDLIDKAEKRL